MVVVGAYHTQLACNQAQYNLVSQDPFCLWTLCQLGTAPPLTNLRTSSKHIWNTKHLWRIPKKYCFLTIENVHLNVGLRKIKETVDQVRIFKTLLFVKVGVIKRISVFNLNSPIWQSNSGGRVAAWPKNKESGTGSEECSSQWQVEKDGERSARGWEEKGKNHHYISRA